MDRRITQPKPVTSPTWGPPPPCKQALINLLLFLPFLLPSLLSSLTLPIDVIQNFASMLT